MFINEAADGLEGKLVRRTDVVDCKTPVPSIVVWFFWGWSLLLLCHSVARVRKKLCMPNSAQGRPWYKTSEAAASGGACKLVCARGKWPPQSFFLLEDEAVGGTQPVLCLHGGH